MSGRRRLWGCAGGRRVLAHNPPRAGDIVSVDIDGPAIKCTGLVVTNLSRIVSHGSHRPFADGLGRGELRVQDVTAAILGDRALGVDLFEDVRREVPAIL